MLMMTYALLLAAPAADPEPAGVLKAPVVKYVGLKGGAMVFEQWIRTGSDGSGVLYLGPTPNWTSGAATCWAEDGTWTRSRWRQSSSTTFNVSG